MESRSFVFSQQLHQSEAPFSHYARVGSLGFVSGIIGQSPEHGGLVSSDPAEQCQAMFDNLATLLDEVGTGHQNLVRTTLYLVDYAEFGVVNDIYRQRLHPPYPVRTSLQAAGLPLGARVQIDAVVDAGEVRGS